MGALDIDSISKWFGDSESQIVAVDDLDLEIEDGEFLVLVGPSGCGKSTTLRCIAGLERPTDGDIKLNGNSILGFPPKSRDIAMVFQSYALYPHMTSRENMSFGLKMTTELSSDEIDRKVEETAAMMGIEDLLGDKPGELSGGQQQRVALGRAIVREPEVFLMDEPLSNLDAKLRSQMRTELQELQQQMDVTTIYVTHDQTEAMTMGDRIAVLNDGELQQAGEPLECYHEPANQFVAGFIGSPPMNFFDVNPLEKNGVTVLSHEFFEVPLSNQILSDREVSNADLTLGIRPEDIKASKSPGKNSFEVRVSVTEPLGEVTYIYFDVDGESYTASVSGDLSIDDGERINLTFPEDKIHLFDETGKSIKNRSSLGREQTSNSAENATS